MELEPRCRDKVLRLMKKGVDIPNPLSIDVGEEVDPERISGVGVRIDPGCRIYGPDTAMGPGARIGREGPVTIENCQLGPGVELKGGYARETTFLERASAGLGAQIREGCLLEEQASVAHCVGLKQTILFPFVTLGSLINFCDCLMAGGTSRQNHSEVGSSYIHFNFTPDGEKTTASLIGDVPRGVMLNQSPVFLGGQGGMVGPLCVAYGTVVGAGSILRRDVLEENKLVIAPTPRSGTIDFVPRVYSGVTRVVEKNLRYLAHLMALEQWYKHVRYPFFAQEEIGGAVYEGARNRIREARGERLKRLRTMSAHMVAALERNQAGDRTAARKREFHERLDELTALFDEDEGASPGLEHRDAFLEDLHASGPVRAGAYVEAIQALPAESSARGTQWLEEIVKDRCSRAASLVPSLHLFRSTGA
ncbi:MAG: protein GlmU [Desulfobacteraceae bacterium]|jgi:UDP-N-acetylglucosamine/UDP-N-acetylgalactosamine diphosphorylase